MKHLILEWTFSMLFTDFKAQEHRIISTLYVGTFTDFLYADAEITVHLPTILWYFKTRLRQKKLRSCTHMMAQIYYMGC